MAEAFIQVEGLRELIVAARALDPAIGKGIRDAVRESVQIVAIEIQRRAPRDTGRLVKSVKPSARGFSGSIIVNARRKSRRYPSGYPYPARIEYARSGGHPFVRPAIAAKAEAVALMFKTKVHDEVERVWGH